MKEVNRKSSARGIARFYAVQMLYQAELLDKAVDDNITIDNIHISEHEDVSGIDENFFRLLLNTVSTNLERIDSVIEEHMSDKWTLDRLDIVLKCILRFGVAEILFVLDVPSNVIFNEYIEIAKSFFEKDDVSFVNGLLNTVAKQYRAETR